MTTAPQWSSVDDDTADLLTLVATGSVVTESDQDVDAFLDACRRDAMAHDGLVSGRGRPMVKAEGAGAWETCEGSASGNDGRPYRLRRWVGAS